MKLLPAFIQNVLSFYQDPIHFLHQKSKSPIHSFRMAHLPFHHITGLEEIKQVMVYEQKSFIKTPQAQYFTSLALGEGLVSTDGDKWLGKRKTANPMFSHQVVDQLIAPMHAAIQKAVKKPSLTNQTVVLNDFMLDIALHAICQLTFGSSDQTTMTRIGQVMDTLIVETYQRVIAPLPIPPILPTAANKRFNQSRKQYDDLIRQLTEKAFQQESKQGLAHRYQLDKHLAETEQINEVALALKTIIAAGHETTATSLTWLLHEMGKHPHIAEILQKELRQVNLASVSNMQSLLTQTPYTQWVIHETLRLYPPIWLMGRMATSPIEIGNQVIQKKGNVLISPFVVHRSEKYWERANDFIPERFDNKELNFLKSAYFPFGLGPRQCIGGHLAMVEMIIILANLYQHYTIDFPQQSATHYHPYITLRPATKILMKLSHL